MERQNRFFQLPACCRKIYLLTVQLSSLYPEALYQKGAWRMFLRPLCSLTSDIEKLLL